MTFAGAPAITEFSGNSVFSLTIAWPGDDGVRADFGAVHDGCIDADEAAIANGATMECRMMRDRTILAYNRRRENAHMDHYKILDIGARADANFIKLCTRDHMRPDGCAGPNIDLPIKKGGVVNKGRIIQRHACSDMSHEKFFLVYVWLAHLVLGVRVLSQSNSKKRCEKRLGKSIVPRRRSLRQAKLAEGDAKYAPFQHRSNEVAASMIVLKAVTS